MTHVCETQAWILFYLIYIFKGQKDNAIIIFKNQS